MNKYDISNLVWKMLPNEYTLKGELYPFDFMLNVQVYPFYLEVWKWEYKEPKKIYGEEFGGLPEIWDFIFELIQRPDSLEKVIELTPVQLNFDYMKRSV